MSIVICYENKRANDKYFLVTQRGNLFVVTIQLQGWEKAVVLCRRQSLKNVKW